MKKISLNLKRKSIFNYLFIALIILNIVFLFWLYSFMKKNIYGAFFPDEELLTAPAGNAGNIDMQKFNTIIDDIKAKSMPNRLEKLNNIFD